MPDTLTRLASVLSDRYAIERELGAGGHGHGVPGATMCAHERQVALKVLRAELAQAIWGPSVSCARSRSPRSLQHPHILPLFDSGEADGLAVLRHALRRGRVAARPRLDARAAAASGRRGAPRARGGQTRSHYAHATAAWCIATSSRRTSCSQGGHALVADFGIALAVQPAGGKRMTQTGLVARHAAVHEPGAGDGRAGRRRAHRRLCA